MAESVEELKATVAKLQRELSVSKEMHERTSARSTDEREKWDTEREALQAKISGLGKALHELQEAMENM
ncbi:hypothetical protein ASPWEDRAFT_39196 [Aspergillus wentii DTO 134E9]|uniref:Uncharacterized protein n=1 Tax=Aspergillus wentii DTO 134E9 TaxID=1073089 RepID=A0A1L9RRP3_ASPWE|nr:uncharacterized protein ASPWEDRAFT_39196 [Aspergillus wentii DTO 134E9]OJJ37497.1 hypothetical protein ASPWEDRAFT_39196 [Aspergillus wentii DTO 134E9]